MTQRILLYTDDSGEGGVALCNHFLLCKLANLGYQVLHAQGAKASSLIQQQQALKIDHLDLGFTAGQDFARTMKDIDGAKKLLAEANPDLVIFSDGWPFSNFAGKQAAIDLGISYITVLHWIDPSCASFSYGDGISYSNALSYHYTQAKAIIVVSYDTLNLMQKMYQFSREKVQVIYNGIPAIYFAASNASTRQTLRQKLGIPQDAIVCFTSARLVGVKGYEYQIEAIQQLKQSDIWPRLYFLWAGTGAGNKYIDIELQLKEAVRSLGATSQVKFLGHRLDIPDLLDASDIFVLPSKAEGMPLSIMEAMAKGLPIIATAVSGIPEELGTTGKLLPNPNFDSEGTVRELVKTIQAWASESELRQSIGQAGKKRAEDLFTEARMVEEAIAVVERVLQSAPTQPSYPISPEQIQLRRRMQYGFLVWNAWRMYSSDRSAAMAILLQNALEDTPFSSTETVLNWVESFSKFSAEKEVKLDIYSLSKSAEWEKVTRLTQRASPHEILI